MQMQEEAGNKITLMKLTLQVLQQYGGSYKTESNRGTEAIRKVNEKKKHRKLEGLGRKHKYTQ